MTAAPWPYKVSADTIAAALRTIATLHDAGQVEAAAGAMWRLRKRVGQEAIDAVTGMPLFADQRPLFDAETCQCCGAVAAGDCGRVRCGRCSGRRHPGPCGGGEAA